MRNWTYAIIAGLALSASPVRAEDGTKETLTLRDGRVLTGVYDRNAGQLTIAMGKGSAVVSIKPSEVVSESTYQSPEEIAAIEDAKRARAEAQRAEAADRDRKNHDAIKAIEDAQAERDAAKKSAENQKALEQDEQRQAHDKAVARAAFWGERGYHFDAAKTSAGQMDEEVQRSIDAQEAKDDQQRREASEREAKQEVEAEQAKKEARATIMASLQAIVDQPGVERVSANCFPKNLQGEWLEVATDGKSIDTYTVADEPARIDVRRMNTEQFQHLYQVLDAEKKMIAFEAYPIMPARSLKYVLVIDGGRVVQGNIGPQNKVQDFHVFLVK
jgi:hypothetical protein